MNYVPGQLLACRKYIIPYQFIFPWDHCTYGATIVVKNKNTCRHSILKRHSATANEIARLILVPFFLNEQLCSCMLSISPSSSTILRSIYHFHQTNISFNSNKSASISTLREQKWSGYAITSSTRPVRTRP